MTLHSKTILSIAMLCLSACSGISGNVDSKDPDERRVGALKLSSRTDAASISKLVQLLDDKDALVRDAAVTALATIGRKELLQHFRAHLDDPSPLVRVGACKAIGKIHNESGIPDLISALKGDKDPFVRIEASNSLAMFKGNKDVVLSLIDAVGDKEVVVSYNAHKLLVDITGAKDVPRSKQKWDEWFDKNYKK